MARFQKKPFPLFEDCMALYAGSVATGDLNFTSTQHLVQPAPPTAPAAPAAPPAPTAPAAVAAPAVAAPAVSDRTSLFDGLDDSTALNEAQSAPPNQESVQGGASGGRKRKQSHIGVAIEDWVQYKKKQTDKSLEELSNKKKQDEAFSIEKCLDEVDAMEGLTDVEKAYAMTIFKYEIDREVFIKMKNKSVRLIWLKQEISDIRRRNVGGGNV